MLEGLGIFLYSDLIFMSGLGLLKIFEWMNEKHNKKLERIKRKIRCEAAKREYLKLLAEG